jgi:hypothetical protein
MSDLPVIIVGAGVVGLVLAQSLKMVCINFPSMSCGNTEECLAWDTIHNL